MSNPLVAPTVDSTTAITGIGLLESANDLRNGIESGSWVEGGLGGLGVGLETLGLALDPFGTLAGYAISWLIEHLDPLSDALDSLAGSPDVIASYATTWGNVHQAVVTAADDLERALEDSASSWVGQGADAYRRTSLDQVASLRAAAEQATSVGSAVELVGTLVGAVREIVRDLIADCVATLLVRIPQWVAEIGATLGVATPHVVSSAVVLISRWVDTIADVLVKLTRSIDNLIPLLRNVRGIWDDLGSGFRAAPSTSPVPSPPTTAAPSAPTPATPDVPGAATPSAGAPGTPDAGGTTPTTPTAPGSPAPASVSSAGAGPTAPSAPGPSGTSGFTLPTSPGTPTPDAPGTPSAATPGTGGAGTGGPGGPTAPTTPTGGGPRGPDGSVPPTPGDPVATVADRTSLGLPDALADPRTAGQFPPGYDPLGGMTPQQYVDAFATGSYPDGSPRWDFAGQAPNNGAVPGTEVQRDVPVGQYVDRYGPPRGSFLSPVPTSYPERALPADSVGAGYHQYEVIRPMPVESSVIAPAFVEQGGGTQFRLDRSVQWYLDNGYLREVF